MTHPSQVSMPYLPRLAGIQYRTHPGQVGMTHLPRLAGIQKDTTQTSSVRHICPGWLGFRRTHPDWVSMTHLPRLA